MNITIIIPTYKPQDYLWECLNSIYKQTFQHNNFEIILVLNGCKEPYHSKIQEYIKDKMQGVNINYIQTDQGGVSYARNIALDKAKGKYITFIDDDDFISPNYLDELYHLATPDTISLSYCYAFNDGNLQKQLPYSITTVYDNLSQFGKQNYLNSRKYFMGPCMKLIPREFIQGRRFNTSFKNGEDSIFMFAISDKFKYVNYTSKEAIYYRRYRVGSAFTSKRSKLNKFENAIKMIITYLNIYFAYPKNYNFRFLVTRILGAIKGAII